MSSIQLDPLYDEEDLDLSDVDPAQLAEFRRSHDVDDDEEDGDSGPAAFSSGSGKVRPLVISNISFGEKRQDKGKSLLKRSSSPGLERGVGGGGGSSSSSSSSQSKRVRWGESENEEQQARDQALLSAISSGLREDLRSEMRSLIQQASKQQSSVDPEEWDRMRLEQRSSSIMSRAAFLTSEGAKAQFGAFAKIKANVEEARQRALAGDGDGVLAALDRMEHVADIRLELIERADRLPGGWPAATIFERLASNGDANKAKLDRAWKSACAEADSKKLADASRKAAAAAAAGRGKAQYARGTQRGNYSFRSVISDSSYTFFLCSFLVYSHDRIQFYCFKTNFVFIL